MEMEDEPLLNTTERYVLYPILHTDIWREYKRQVASFWTPEELDFSQDIKHWETLNTEERYFIKNILAFFAGSDGIIMENLLKRFTEEVSLLEIKFSYGFQAMMEGIHSETYSLMIDTLIKDPQEKYHLLNAIQTIPCVSKKAHWAIHWLNDESSFATRLLAFACVEGIFFSGSFCAIYWLKQRGVMPGLTTSNELISRDEGLHTDFACLLYSKIKHRLTKDKVYEIVKQAVDIEKEFICSSLPCSLLGMNQDLMSQYIEFITDRLLSQLQYPKLYNTKNPFDFMERISLESKDNFFEKRPTNYSLTGVGKEPSQMTFGVDADF